MWCVCVHVHVHKRVHMSWCSCGHQRTTSCHDGLPHCLLLQAQYLLVQELLDSSVSTSHFPWEHGDNRYLCCHAQLISAFCGFEPRSSHFRENMLLSESSFGPLFKLYVNHFVSLSKLTLLTMLTPTNLDLFLS